jgi:hypothetical protein
MMKYAPGFWNWNESPPTPQPPQAPRMPVPMVYEPATRTAWEYRVVVIDAREEEPLTEAQAAELGAEGWLLAAVLDRTDSGRSGGRLHYYFVRPAL